LGFAQTFTSVVFSLAESPLKAGELWAGTDDGLVQLSRDAGKTWTNITPKDWPEWLRINSIDLSHYDAGTAYVAANRYLMDDQQPYVYKTTDYGKTWQTITNGIGPNDYAHVLREDPVRPGLLYLGTERGMYVSFDAGESWQSLQLNLPAVAVFDLLVKDNDVVIGTHSRGFWILDDVTPLRQLTDDVIRSSAHLFQVTPAYRLIGAGGFGGGRVGAASDVISYGGEVAYKDVEGANGQVKQMLLNGGANPPSGVVITYFLKEKPTGEAVLTIKDRTGSVIKRFSSQTPAPGDPRVPAEPGTNRFVWNMRYPNSRELSPGAALSTMEWPRATAPVAPPGNYIAQLDVAGQTYEQPFEIRKDPRISWSDADLTAQFDLWIRVRDELSESTDTINRLREIRKQVEAGAGQSGKAEAAKQIESRLATIEAALTRTVGANSMLLPPKGLNQKFATLTNIIGSGDGAPTRWTYEVVEELSAQLMAYITQLNTLVASDDVHEFLQPTRAQGTR
jgi:hypothetical protein